MNIEYYINENKLLREENAKLKEDMEKHKTAHRPYYEKNKEIINEKSKQRLKKLAQENPDKLKEINRRSYLKRKEKIKNNGEIKEN